MVKRECANGGRITWRIPFWPDTLKERERVLGMRRLSLQQNSKIRGSPVGIPRVKSLFRKFLYLIRLVRFIGHHTLSFG